MNIPYTTFLLLISLLAFSCNNSPPNSTKETQTDSTHSVDSNIIPTTTSSENTTKIPADACQDWTFEFDGPEGEVVLVSDCALKNGSLHFWPSNEMDSSSIETLIAGYSFGLLSKEDNSKYNNLTGKMIAYHSNGRKMAEIDLVEGNHRGLFAISDAAGKILVYRNYPSSGPPVSKKELYAHRWSFDTTLVDLTIDQQTIKTENNTAIVALSFVGQQQESDFYVKRIWDRAPFKVNGQVFTGTVRGYSTEFVFDKHQMDAFKIFEIEFKDGLLHGHFNLWSSYMGHQLDEVFEKGALKETIHKLNPEDMEGMAKPVIYLYPEKEQTVQVKLHLKGKLVHPYPRYEKNLGWNVLAKPNGQLTDIKSGKEFYCLYWEGLSSHQFDLSTGFVVKGNESIEFLEEKLAQLGLNRREANEMIIYWLPRMENNPYNLIYFAFEEYEAVAKLHISPQPDRLIRVMMVFKGLEQAIPIQEQVLPNISHDRTGFTAVEWGGQEVGFDDKASSSIF